MHSKVAGTGGKAEPPLMVNAKQAGKIVGADLGNTTRDGAPPPPIEVDPSDCGVAAGPSTRSVYTDGWTQYHLVTMREASDYWDHSITQTAGKYADEASASRVFDALNAGLKECVGPNAAVTDVLDDATSEWTFSVDSAETAALRWVATQADGNDWSCFRDARLVRSWVVQVAVCQAGNGRPAATAIAERLSKNVSAE